MIPYKRKTEIVKQRIDASFERSDKMIAYYKAQGGGFLGDIEPPADVRLNRYWLSITLKDGSIDAHDMALIMDPHTELKLRTGVDADGPHSVTWINFLRLPGLFTEQAKDFVHLNQLEVERREKQGNSELGAPSAVPGSVSSPLAGMSNMNALPPASGTYSPQ